MVNRPGAVGVEKDQSIESMMVFLLPTGAVVNLLTIYSVDQFEVEYSLDGNNYVKGFRISFQQRRG